MSIRTRIQRPTNLDYLADVRNRGGPIGLLNLAALGTTSTDQRKPYQVEQRVAIIYITGLLSNDAYWWDETDYRDLQSEISQAAEDGDVDGILLVVSSPGGYTDNAFETAAVLAEAGKKKPMWAVADTIAYSAAYLLVSQAAKIYVPKMTGGVGSVGIYCAHFDYSELLKKEGIAVTLISEGEGKTDANPYEPLSERALADIKTEMKRLYGLFVGAVATGRKLTESQVRKLGAYCYEGSQESLGVGLADVAGSASEALTALIASVQASKKFSPNAAALATANSPKEVSAMTETTQPAANALPDEALLAKARKEGRDQLQAEAKEIQSLCQIAGSPALAAGFLAEGKSPAEVRDALLKAKADQGDKDQINSHSHASTGAKPAKSLAERMAAKFGGKK